MKQILKISTRKVLLFMAIITACSVYAQPQGGERGGPKGPPPIPNSKQIEKMVDKLSAEINLSKEQETKVLAVYESHFKELESKTSSGSKVDRSEMQKLKTSFETEVKALLTKEQQTKYTAYVEEQMKQRQKQKR